MNVKKQDTTHQNDLLVSKADLTRARHPIQGLFQVMFSNPKHMTMAGIYTTVK